MLQCFVRFSEFTEFSESSAPFREKPHWLWLLTDDQWCQIQEFLLLMSILSCLIQERENAIESIKQYLTNYK